MTRVLLLKKAATRSFAAFVDSRDVYGFPVCNVRIICNKDDPITTKIKNASTTGPTVNFSLSFVEELMSTMPRLWMFELNFFCFACKTLLLAPACFLDDWIGLDWIGFLEREKEKRDGTQVNEGEQHERTNERRHFSAFVSWSFLRRQRPESVDQKQRTESRTFPNFTTRDTKERRFCARRKTRKDTRIRAYACVYAHTHTHTHTHTEREREREICAPCRFLSFVSARVVR